ncbi:MAG: T9SS type A sorting domain-containing protein, partial [Bacteroidetes bacterium]|nr:T9SS type A sorting domain-containing protein [Bacteroidota bacterium]
LTVGDGSNTHKLTKPDYISVEDVATAINDNQSNNDLLSIYPNPASFNVYIKSTENFSLSIFNPMGQELLYRENLNSIAIDVSEYGKGIYMINIKSERGTMTRKLVVE